MRVHGELLVAHLTHEKLLVFTGFHYKAFGDAEYL
jgi:hypothetical protein